jgi:hypothetical protein
MSQKYSKTSLTIMPYKLWPVSRDISSNNGDNYVILYLDASIDADIGFLVVLVG